MTTSSLPGNRKARWPVAVLGATGAVGQMFVRLLADHPWFELKELAASERSAGKKYGEVTRWLEGASPRESIMSRRVIACDPGLVSAPIVFSALDLAGNDRVERGKNDWGAYKSRIARDYTTGHDRRRGRSALEPAGHFTVLLPR